MYTKFEIGGIVDKVEVKPTKKDPSRHYGRISVATGTAAIDFFIEPHEADQYPKGTAVRVKGTIGMKGFTPQLEAESIVILKAAKAA